MIDLGLRIQIYADISFKILTNIFINFSAVLIYYYRIIIINWL